MSTDTYRESSATGWVIFAAGVMFIVGAIDIIQGLAALLKETTYVIPGGEKSLLVTTNFDRWGWALIIWGIVLILAAGSLFSGRSWARWFSIVVILVNAVGQIAWFPAYPLWSMVAIALSAVILFALTARWQDAKTGLGD